MLEMESRVFVRLIMKDNYDGKMIRVNLSSSSPVDVEDSSPV